MTDISHEKQKCKFQTSHQTTRSKQRVYNAERRNHTEPKCSHLPRTHPAQVRRAHMSTSLHRVRSHLYKRAIKFGPQQTHRRKPSRKDKTKTALRNKCKCLSMEAGALFVLLFLFFVFFAVLFAAFFATALIISILRTELRPSTHGFIWLTTSRST